MIREKNKIHHICDAANVLTNQGKDSPSKCAALKDDVFLQSTIIFDSVLKGGPRVFMHFWGYFNKKTQESRGVCISMIIYTYNLVIYIDIIIPMYIHFRNTYICIYMPT